MKVAVSAVGPSLEDKVDERFGRTAYLLIVDSESFEYEAIDNGENRDAMHGAGIGTAEIVAGQGVESVVTGHLGPKAYAALQAAGIEGFGGAGASVREAVEALVAGRLDKLAEAPAHSGM